LAIDEFAGQVVPDAHGSGAVEPSGQYFPTGHMAMADAAVTEPPMQYDPGTHRAQPDANA
jgi:hypothetical protein